MKTIKKVILFSSILMVLSCEKRNDSIINDPDKLIGYWINPLGNDTILTFQKASALKDNDYGFAFKKDSGFVERKIARGCGTPPISYADFEGSWIRNDSLISITTSYWGGSVNYQWIIISLDNNQLKIHKLKEEYHIKE
ncbi:hypothetical protein [Williamwhitmania taraxaci]|uniref:Lipocalin-like domain-containing protein n=1 Tax=Williamwhitmania taraxaci TaxID=1640674 RepID=A0A1G6H9E0_9BACT|nr:hypothetical protein [Williamwhitmania taraxaci]SDB90764.1 hypothetical protein SAMN05216323_100849 [Williamwhitmania taraxaci]